MWDPNQYARFSAQRSRPFFDLFAQVEKCTPASVVDLGCGSGQLTRFFARRWPDAQVLGIDASAEMLEMAWGYAIPGRLIFQQCDLTDWTPEHPIDLIFSNAVLHWVADHQALIPQLAAHVSRRGTLAFQVPNNYTAPSHQILTRVARSSRWKDILGDLVDIRHVLPIHWYVRTLTRLEFAVDAWETEYIQILSGERPVLEWLKGTTLRPLLQRLESSGLQEDFLDELGHELEQAYPQEETGTLFPFRRIFVVAYRNVDCMKKH